MSLEFAKLKGSEVLNIMIKSENLVIGRQLYEVFETKFLENEWVHVSPIRQGKIAEFQCYLDPVTFLGISN